MPIKRLSTWAALACKNPLFREWLNAPDEETAVKAVRATCNIKSRSELDTDPAAAQIFHQYIRLPFSHFAHNHK